MKKAFNLKFLALSALLMLGNAVAFAGARPANTVGPADNTAVGATIKIGDQMGLVTYRVTGWDATNDFYTVKITGFDADGLAALQEVRDNGGKVTLRVPVTFEEKFGENKYKYAVTLIEDGVGAGDVKQSFYGLTEVDTLIFVGTGYNGVGLDKFSYTVGTKSFYGCTNVKKLEFTENCSAIGTYAFQNCAIREFVIPKKCAAIGSYAFYNCKFLRTVTVAEGNTVMHTLDNYVFGNSALTTLDLRNAAQLWTLAAQPFMYDLSIINDVLKTVYLPQNVKDINTAFKDCTALTNVYGFESTKLGEAVNVPAGSPVGTHIGATAFNGCRSLTRLDIPSCNVIGSPFTGCAALDTLTFNGDYKEKTIAQTLAVDHNLYGVTDVNDANYKAADQAALKVIAFNNDFRGTIKANAFVGVTALDSVGFKKLTNGATIEAAFTDVTSLNKLTFAGIDTYANNTDKDGAVVIGDDAFKNTGITTLDFKTINLKGDNAGANDFTIGWGAFSYCAALTDVKFGDITENNVITIQNNHSIIVQTNAFNNNPLLAKVTFGKTAFTGTGTLQINADAFATSNVALTDVEFGNITSTTAAPAGFDSNVIIGTAAANVFGDGAHLQTVKFGKIDAGTFTIEQQAFQSTGLKEIEFGDITTPHAVNSTFTINDNAFNGGDVEAKTVKFGNISETNIGQMTFAVNASAFAADSLKSVEFGNITAKDVDFGIRAFQGKNLQTVKMCDITASANAASTFDIALEAFQGGEVAAKTVTIGKIQNHTSPAKDLTATISGNDAFAGDSLATVKIGDMTAASLTISGVSAFAGKALTRVELGKMTAAILAISGNQAFANLNTEDAMNDSIIIGEIGGGLDITGANIFKGPQGAGSALNVKIEKFSGAATIPANTFQAPLAADGTATFTVTGDVAAGSLASVAAGMFDGAQKYVSGAPVENTTSVWFQGDYNDEFAAANIFTNVCDVTIAVDKDLKAKKYTVAAGNLDRFQNAMYVVVGDMPAGAKIVASTAGSTQQIETVVFAGGVADANAIGAFNSPKIRKIGFTGVDSTGVKVAAGAVAATAFQAAGADAKTKGEKISVIYKEEQTREAEIIFNQTAFAGAAGAEVATLYTTSWAKANIYEAADILDANKQCVYGLGYSESAVIPGMPIFAKTVKKEGNTYGYAKLYIPKGINMKYKVPALYDAASDKNGIQLYYGRIDNSNNKIYMYSLPVIDDFYWIDATEVDQAFVLRTNSDIYPDADVYALPVEAEEDAIFTPGDADHYYFDASLAVQNQLRYNVAEIANQELRNNAEFEGRDVYVMANPLTAAGGFAFAKFNKDATYSKDSGDHLAGDLRCLSAKSLYIVGKKNVAGAPELEVVFEGDEGFDAEATGIETVKNAENSFNGAIFNLQGVRVSNAQKGLYIMNGKKFVVK